MAEGRSKNFLRLGIPLIPTMNNESPDNLPLKAKASIIQRVRFFFTGSWGAQKIVITGVLVATLAMVVFSIYPEQSTQDFTAPTTSSTGLEFSNTKLKVYDNLTLAIKQPQIIGYTETKSGKIEITGKIKNISDSEKFVTAGFIDGRASLKPFGVSLQSIQPTKNPFTELEVKNSTYSTNNTGLTGYYIQPGEKLSYQLISAQNVYEDRDSFELQARWVLQNAEATETLVAAPNFVFEAAGTTLVWGNAEINWLRKIPHYRGAGPMNKP